MDLQNQVMVFEPATRTFSSELHQVSKLQTGEVLVRVRCCTICGSDLHTWSGRRDAPKRCVLGHEIIGEVVAWGGSQPPMDYFGQPVEKGQRITWSMVVSCKQCFYCRHGSFQKCEDLFKYGHELAEGHNATGGLSSYCHLVQNTDIFPIPDELPDRVATPANCATATVCAAMRLVSETHQIESAHVLIVGMGMLGLTAASRFAELGAKSVIVSDPDLKRLATAREFGATHTPGTDKELAESISSATKDRGVDVAIDFAGVSQAVEKSISSLRKGGCAILAGSVFPTQKLSFSPEFIVRNMLTLRGIHNYQPIDLKDAIDFLQNTYRRYPFGELVEVEFPLSDAAAAFEHAAAERPIRAAIV